MIVKNEASIIRSTLSDLLSKVKIDTWVIHDTGSEDGTPQIIEEFFASYGIAGQLIHRAWENFGANRQYALKDAEGLTDYVLFWDADCKSDGDFPIIDGTADAYMLNARRNVIYTTKSIVRNNGDFKWRGVVHEGLYFYGKKPEVSRQLEGDFTILNLSAGARSRDPQTYQKDAEQLVNAINNIADEDRDLLPRYTFYAANSWRDAKMPREAAEWYIKRTKLGGWADEIFSSWLGLGIELQKLGDELGALNAWLRGHEVSPDRAECLYHAARYQRAAGKPHAALILATEASKITVPTSARLFVWKDVYDYWVAYEVAMAAKAIGKTQTEVFEAAILRLKGPTTPPDLLRQVQTA
jgi:tetratricopeptide (TPR) repeat protein